MNALHPRLTGPMAIAPGWRDAIAAAWERWTMGTRVRADRPRASEPGAVVGSGGLLRIVDGVGLITISGPLTNDSGEWAEFICEIFGGTTYASIWRAIEAGKKQARQLLLRFDTPGGDADGVGSLARYIASVSAEMPVWSHVGAQCCSAGIWLASQTSRIDAVPEATVGSIGVRCKLWDVSAMLKEVGVREIELVANVGPKKRATPIDDEVLAGVQALINDLGVLFVGAVASGRRVTAEEVIANFGSGGVMLAAAGADCGLIDNVSDFNQTLDALKAVGASNKTVRAVTGGAIRTLSVNTSQARRIPTH